MRPATLDPKLEQRLGEAERRFAEVNESLASREVLSNPGRLRALGQERAHLEPIVTAGAAARLAMDCANSSFCCARPICHWPSRMPAITPASAASVGHSEGLKRRPNMRVISQRFPLAKLARDRKDA